LAAFGAQTFGEAHGNVAATALGRNIDRNFYQIAVGIIGEMQLAH
jgi:hypothetical protein